MGPLLTKGMVLLSDTRTNAGLDNISTCRKMFLFEGPDERVIAIMTAGSLSVTQTAPARLRAAMKGPDAAPDTSILQAQSMLKVAAMMGNPEGNLIEATGDTPFLQIGEHEYGKPILGRAVRPETDLMDARKAVLLSMEPTLRPNLSMGMPLPVRDRA